jgi:alkylated DNA repair protein (DNA oxidative demethylase)
MMRFESFPLPLDESRGYFTRLGIGSRALLLRGFAGERAPELVAAIGVIAAASPFRHMVTPGGWEMSVAQTNCGEVGWVTDRTGYRYDAIDPETGSPWPEMSRTFADLASDVAALQGSTASVPMPVWSTATRRAHAYRPIRTAMNATTINR